MSTKASAVPEIVAVWHVDKTRYRLVRRPGYVDLIDAAVLERCEVDAAGGDRWVCVDIGFHDKSAQVLVHGIEAQAQLLRRKS